MKFNLISQVLLTFGLIAQTSYAGVTGEWYKDCNEISQAGTAAYVTSYYNFHDDGTFTLEESAYQDKVCNKLFILTTMEGTYTADDQGNLDLVLTKQFLTFSSLLSPLMPVLNLSNFCGYKNWKVDLAQDVTERTCNLMGQDIPTITVGDMSYNIYQLTNNELFLGTPSEDYDGSSQATRPIELGTVAFKPL